MVDPESPDKDAQSRRDLSEEDKRFTESDLGKKIAASPEFRQMLEDQRRIRDLFKRVKRQPEGINNPRYSNKEKDTQTGNIVTVQPGSVLDTLSRVGEGLSKFSEGIVRAVTTAPTRPEVERQSGPEVPRSKAMLEFFERVERYRGHGLWLVGLVNNWTVVPIIATCAWGGGIAAMQMDQFLIAIGFFVLTSFILAMKAIASESDRERTYVIAILAVLFLVANIAWAIYSHRQFGK